MTYSKHTIEELEQRVSMLAQEIESNEDENRFMAEEINKILDYIEEQQE